MGVASIKTRGVSLLKFLPPRPSRWWDVAPRGFEHMSPLQFKAMQGGL